MYLKLDLKIENYMNIERIWKLKVNGINKLSSGSLVIGWFEVRCKFIGFRFYFYGELMLFV